MIKAAQAVVLWLATIAMAYAQTSNVEVRSPSTKLVSATPGSIVTLSVVVGNRSGETDEFADQLSLPSGCERVAPPELPFRVEGGGQLVRVLAVLVPANMRAGRHSLRYSVQSRRDPASMGLVDFEMQVSSVDDLEMVIDPQSGPILAGDEYPIRLRVSNHGNSPVSAQLTRRSSLGFAVSLETPAFNLEAGASREIVCQVRTDKLFDRHASHVVSFDLTATSITGKPLSASQASAVEIIPRISGKVDPYHQFPMQHRLIGIAATGQEAMVQVEFSGNGTLDEAGEHRIDFLLRGPDTQESIIFGERDEYGISYHGTHWDVDLGDRIYALSPLTEWRSLGRGAGVAWRREKLSVGGFWMTTRFRQQNSQELATFVQYDFSKQLRLRGNFLRKTGDSTQFMPALPQNLHTLEAHYQPGKWLNLKLEGGFSRSDGGITDHAYRVDARGELPGELHYSLEHTHAGPDFGGYFNDTSTLYASVSRSVTKDLKVHANYNRFAGNLALNDVRSAVVTRENSWNIGADYNLAAHTTLSLQWQHNQRQDILAPAAFDFVEDSVRLGMGHRFSDKLHVQQLLDLGLMDNALTGEDGSFLRSATTLNWRPTSSQTYSLFGGYGPSAFTASTANALNLGVTARWQINKQLLANVSYAINQYDGLAGREQNQLFASLRHVFKNKSSLSLIGRLTRSSTRTANSSRQDEAAVMVTFTTPFSMPVSSKRSIGMLQGRVINNSQTAEAGVPRVVLQAGDRFAVTDEAGKFEFPGLKPGEHVLKIQADSLGPNLALSQPLAEKVRVRAADVTWLEIAVAPACSLEVYAMRYQFAEGHALNTSGKVTEAGAQEAVTLEISNGSEIWRAQTDRTGYARFDRLPAGAWTLRAACQHLPPLHVLEGAAQSIQMKPGQSQTTRLRVVPQRRTLRLLDGGSVR